MLLAIDRPLRETALAPADLLDIGEARLLQRAPQVSASKPP